MGFGIWDLGSNSAEKGFAGAEGQGGKLLGNDPVFPALLPPSAGWGEIPEPWNSGTQRGAFPGEAAQVLALKTWDFPDFVAKAND